MTFQLDLKLLAELQGEEGKAILAAVHCILNNQPCKTPFPRPLKVKITKLAKHLTELCKCPKKQIKQLLLGLKQSAQLQSLLKEEFIQKYFVSPSLNNYQLLYQFSLESTLKHEHSYLFQKKRRAASLHFAGVHSSVSCTLATSQYQRPSNTNVILTILTKQGQQLKLLLTLQQLEQLRRSVSMCVRNIHIIQAIG